MAFTPRNAKTNPNRQAWADSIGSFYYFALILGQFNPKEAERIFDSPAHVIAEAFVSKLAHEYTE